MLKSGKLKKLGIKAAYALILFMGNRQKILRERES